MKARIENFKEITKARAAFYVGEQFPNSPEFFVFRSEVMTE